MFLTGKKLAVAERHWKLARHEVSGHPHQIGFVPKGRWTFNAWLQGHFRRHFTTKFFQPLAVRPKLVSGELRVPAMEKISQASRERSKTFV
jgi:hypothetical protein